MRVMSPEQIQTGIYRMAQKDYLISKNLLEDVYKEGVTTYINSKCFFSH